MRYDFSTSERTRHCPSQFNQLKGKVKAGSKMDVSWVELELLPSDFKCSPNGATVVQINDTEILVMPDSNGEDKKRGFYKYCAIKDEWTRFLQYPEDFSVDICYMDIVFDDEKKILYHVKYDNIDCIDVVRKKIDLHDSKALQDIYQWGLNLLVIQDDMHIIGGLRIGKHYVYNMHDDKASIVHDFEGITEIYGAGVVYVKSRQEIILFCGVGADDDAGTINLRVFSLKTQKWRKIDGINFYKMGHVRHVLIDDKYIIFGACLRSPHKHTRENKLFVLEIGNNDQYILTEADEDIKIAIDLQIYVTRDKAKDNLLVYAWLKHYFKKSDFNLEISSDVIRIIQTFFCTSMLHAWAYDHYSAGRHKAISVDVLLQFRAPLSEDTFKALEENLKAMEPEEEDWTGLILTEID